MARHKRRNEPDANELALAAARMELLLMPALSRLAHRAVIVSGPESLATGGAWALVSSNGVVHVNSNRRANEQEWLYVLAHCLLHLAFDHHREHADQRAWNLACCLICDRFLAAVDIGERPDGFITTPDVQGSDEQDVYQELRLQGVPPGYEGDLLIERVRSWQRTNWPELFARGLRAAVTQAIERAGGITDGRGASLARAKSEVQLARDWFITSYPLLGALAAGLELVEDARACDALAIAIAAVDASAGRVYLNPRASLTGDELRFVLAHEYLHVALGHELRRQGRDPYLWNVACDYAINHWLCELHVGTPPGIGILIDPTLGGHSAEEIYDRIVGDLRRYRRLATLAGKGACDMIPGNADRWWERGAGVDVDAFYRSALARGLEYHQLGSRGLLPAGLVDEITTRIQPPIPWDVQLARFLDPFFPAPERSRTYARPSRRQSATPDIPRPRLTTAAIGGETRTFAVVVDTSGSMPLHLLEDALGTVVSYCYSRDVGAVRVIWCDAAAYDSGYLTPEALMGRVEIRGRGGTILQPAIDLLVEAEDFPGDAPILIVTDAFCDHVHVPSGRAHAYLVPPRARLPFSPRGPVFTVDN